MQKTHPILCIGAIIADIICELPYLPASGEGLVVNASRMSLGGCAYNNAMIIKQLGGDAVLFAPLGNGMYANFIREQLASTGLRGLEVQAQKDSGVCICMVEPSGERTMFTMPGIEREYQDAWFKLIDASQYTAALVGGYEINGAGGEAIIRFLEDNPHIQSYFAPGPTAALINKQKIARINATKPIWHLNMMEAQQFSESDSVIAAAQIIAAASNNAVVITAGSNGTYLYCQHSDSSLSAHQTESWQLVHYPALPINPIDTIGAGDSHLGALAYARNAGLTWELAIRLANQVAARVCQQPGPTLEKYMLEDLAL
jgi:sugar/nucleoside kinase (ribokinase family)